MPGLRHRVQPMSCGMRDNVRYPAEQRRIMARNGLRARGITLVILAATAAAGCGTAAGGSRAAMSPGARSPGRMAGSSQPATPGSRAPRGTRTAGGYPAAFVAAVAPSFRVGPHALAVFSSSDGRLLRWLVHGAPDPVPVTVSPDGRWLYYYDQDAGTSLTPGWCPNTGFVDPVLWKVPAGGGCSRRAGLRTPSIAFSPDGRMVAYTVSSRCGRVIRIVVRDRRTGATRRVLLVRNDLRGNNQIGSAQLSWAPDDAHLAVAVAPAAAINALSVINALRARTVPFTRRSTASSCARGNDECLDPAFDIRGRLTFVKWRNVIRSTGDWVIRWYGSRARRLFRVPGPQVGSAVSIAVDRTGNAVLAEDSGARRPEIWRWNHGHLSGRPRRS
jgi:hypothetical protein